MKQQIKRVVYLIHLYTCKVFVNKFEERDFSFIREFNVSIIFSKKLEVIL